jgi:hypothetical protein
MLRRFHLLRKEDVSGLSGCGIVASGVVFDDGRVALEWAGEHSSINLYSKIEDVEYLHGHKGKTQIIWQD